MILYIIYLLKLIIWKKIRMKDFIKKMKFRCALCLSSVVLLVATNPINTEGEVRIYEKIV